MKPDEMRSFVRAMRDALKYTPQEMRDFCNIVVLERKAHFERHQGPDGEMWAPLRPSTIRSKSSAGYTTKYKQNREGNRFVAGGSFQKVKIAASANPEWPLVRTGAMMNAYVQSATPMRGVVALAKSRTQPVWGGKSIAQIHNDGIGVAARPHIGIPKAAVERINKAASEIVERKIAELIGRRR